MAVTIPSANGIVTIAPGTGDVLGLAAQIGANLSVLGSQDLTQYSLYSGSGDIPAAPTTPGVSQVLDINSSSPFSQTVPGGYGYVLDLGSNEGDLTVNNAQLVTGTVGGTFNLTGTSTIAATGGNNTVTGTGNYVMTFGPGNNVIFADGTGTVATNTSPSSSIIVSGNADGTGSNFISSQGTNDFVVAQGSTSVDATGSGFQLLGAGGAITASISGAGATVSTANSDANITAAGDSANILGGSGTSAGALNVNITGNNNSVGAFDSNATINSSGDNSLIVGGTGASSVNVTAGTGDTLIGGAGPGAMTVDATTAVQMFGGSGPINFVGGAGTSSLLGGAGGSEAVTVGAGGILLSTGTNNTSTIVGSSNPGVSTIFGGSGSDVNFNESVSSGTLGGAYLIGGSGNETLNGSQSNANETLGGGDSTGADSLLGGSGSNTFFAGAGADTMVGGPNQNIFGFFANNVSSGTNYVITDFSSQDTLALVGFGNTQSLSSILENATTGANGLTITLSDNVTITFSNLTDTSLLAKQTLYS